MDTHTAELLIRISVALTMVLFGINQFLKPGKWIDYIPEAVRRLSPMKPDTTMRLHALGNIVIGLWLAVGVYIVVGTWVSIIWWISILPFALLKDWRIALRDASIIGALIALLTLLK